MADGAMVELVIPIGMAATLVGGGVAYGMTKQKVDAAHRRIDELVQERFEHSKAVDRKLDRIEKTLTELAINVARIGPKVHTHNRNTDDSDA